VALHVPRYARALPHYSAYEGFLKVVLKEATRQLALLAIVEARPAFLRPRQRRSRVFPAAR
jgi:hypothetical protein